jgi:hypothetical protein
LTPDPGGTETANPKNPGSWNQYAYVNADPVNHNDPSGTTMAGLQFCTGAVFPWDEEDCGDDTSGFVEAGAGGNWGGFNPCNRSQWLPNPLCPVQLVLLAPPSSPPPNATYLLVIGDCDYTGFGGHDVRRREYEVLDQHFQAMGNGLKVSESITKVTPTGHTIRGGGNWNTGEDGVSGAFYDFYSNGRNSTPTNALQEYFSGSTRLQVLEPDNLTNNPSTYSRYGTQGVYYTYSGVRIDSYYSNPIIGSKTPCDPPTPFF